ncbi:hypothetical protein CYMTET_10312, partial [Cymbomonas tetramitiformis]
YKTVDDYYRDNSSGDVIEQISIPMLCIQAEDDPISLDRAIPRSAIAANPNTVLVTTPTGGHLGWTAGDRAPFGAPWTNKPVIEYFVAMAEIVARQRESCLVGASSNSEESL